MDGTTDIVFLTCPQAKDCTVNIIYNKQLPLCTISATSNCRSQSDLCSVDKNFHLSANPSVSTLALSFLGMHYSHLDNPPDKVTLTFFLGLGADKAKGLPSQ